jgi:uncharacterized membrane protein YjfL (UPF0719 family)
MKFTLIFAGFLLGFGACGSIETASSLSEVLAYGSIGLFGCILAFLGAFEH